MTTSTLPQAALAYIGRESEVELACDAVEPGAVRRYAQAIMDENPIYSTSDDGNARYGGSVAPPLYPTHLFRRAFGTPDPIQENAFNVDFDGIGATSAQGLPQIEPLKGYALLNGGIEIECLRYARHGERVRLKSRYADISEKLTSKGALILVVIESEYRTAEGELLVRVRRTQIRRKPE